MSAEPTSPEPTSPSAIPGRMRAFSDQRGRSGSTSSYTRAVVLAVDASENAAAAFDWYLQNIHRPDDLIVLTHIPEAPKLPNFSFKSGMALPVVEWKEILDDMNSKTRKLEEDYEGRLISRKLKYKVRGEAAKNVGEMIVKICEDEQADMVILGTRGLGAIRRAVLGSVSDYVVRNAPCPLVTVPYQRMKKAERRRTSSQINFEAASPPKS